MTEMSEAYSYIQGRLDAPHAGSRGKNTRVSSINYWFLLGFIVLRARARESLERAVRSRSLSISRDL